jgi:hypothetical protein
MIHVIQTFENEPFKEAKGFLGQISRIDIILPSLFQAQAIGGLLKEATPSDSQYNFFCFRPESNQDLSIISLCANVNQTGKKVDAVFTKTFKQNLSNFLSSLSSNWVQRSKEEPELSDDSFLLINLDSEKIMSTKLIEGNDALYECLIEESKAKIELGSGFDNAYIAGSAEEINKFLSYLHSLGEDFQKKIKIRSE